MDESAIYIAWQLVKCMKCSLNCCKSFELLQQETNLRVNPVMAIFPGANIQVFQIMLYLLGNIPSDHSKSDIETFSVGIETNHKYMSIIIAQKCV